MNQVINRLFLIILGNFQFQIDESGYKQEDDMVQVPPKNKC